MHLTVVLTALTFLIGSVCLAWGVRNVQSAAIADEFRSYEPRVLQFEGFALAAAKSVVDSTATQNLGDCETHAQRALLLLEIPLAEAALRAGTLQEFDRRLRSIQDRSGRVLACVPRDSLAWLLLFGVETMHGRIDNHAFKLLEASYETSPNEAWVALRRTTVATPLLLSAPEGIRQKILDEFKNLIGRGFEEIPARAYLAAPAPAKKLLQSRIEELEPRRQESFARTVQKLRS
jgi:hypothetical protein